MTSAAVRWLEASTHEWCDAVGFTHWREVEALGACPGCGPILPAVLPGGYAWLVARRVARAASCLKGKGGTTEL